MSTERDSLTVIFAKRPVPGEVKTRLEPALEPTACAALAEAMLRDLAARLTTGLGTGIGTTPGSALGVAFAPPCAESEAWFRAALPGLAGYWPQRGAGLAERLAAFFEQRFAAGAQRVVVVGSDAPLLPLERVDEAHRALAAGSELVLGPDSGGGYCLVGLARPVPALFTEVAMSTGDMFARTLEVAQRHALRTRCLEPSFDVDLPADLERLAREIEARDPELPDHPRLTAAWLAARELLR